MGKSRRRIVVLAHMCPFPPVHGNRSRFVRLLEWFRDNGIAVTFILQPLDVDSPQELHRLRELVDRLEVVRAHGPLAGATEWAKRTLVRVAHVLVPDRPRRFAVRLFRRSQSPPPQLREAWGSGEVGGDGHIDTWCWPATCRAVERAIRRDRPIAVLAEYALLTKSFEAVPPHVLKVIDTVEVFFRNQERFDTPGLIAPRVCSRESEVLALSRADLLIGIQRNDTKQLSDLFPATRVITVPHAYQQLSRRPEGPSRGSVLYVGSSNPFNVHGLREFVAQAWPSIVARVPTATLRVVGSVPVATHAGTDRVVHVGRVDDAELAREYQAAHVVVNPQLAGTGLKIKCVEALSAGCPLVTNRAGADGLEEGEGVAFLVPGNWHEFADHVVRLLTDDQIRLGLEAHARAFADRMFSPHAVFSELAAALAVGRNTP